MSVKVKFVRGIPGSGKSTYAKKHFTDYIQCEADDYFYLNDESIYDFDSTKLHLAHKYCQRKFRQAIFDGKNVVVSNTFINLREFKQYKEFLNVTSIETDVEIITLDTDFGSVHGVPSDIISRMKQNIVSNDDVITYFKK